MIKRIAALRYICKKYDLQYSLKLFGDKGSIGFFDKEGADRYEFISVSLFSKHFWAILFHEVGHLVAKRTLQYQNIHCEALDIEYKFGTQELYTLLGEEAVASKFSNRMLKGKDSTFLKKCWHTYTGYAAKVNRSQNLNKYVTIVDKYSKYFEDQQKDTNNVT